MCIGWLPIVAVLALSSMPELLLFRAMPSCPCKASRTELVSHVVCFKCWFRVALQQRLFLHSCVARRGHFASWQMPVMTIPSWHWWQLRPPMCHMVAMSSCSNVLSPSDGGSLTGAQGSAPWCHSRGHSWGGSRTAMRAGLAEPAQDDEPGKARCKPNRLQLMSFETGSFANPCVRPRGVRMFVFAQLYVCSCVHRCT